MLDATEDGTEENINFIQGTCTLKLHLTGDLQFLSKMYRLSICDCISPLENSTRFALFKSPPASITVLRSSTMESENINFIQGTCTLKLHLTGDLQFLSKMYRLSICDCISPLENSTRFALVKSPPASMTVLQSSTMESKQWGTQEPLLSITGSVLSGKTGIVVSLQVLEYEKVYTGGGGGGAEYIFIIYSAPP